MKQTSDNDAGPRLWIDVVRERLEELIQNPNQAQQQSYQEVLRSFYSLHYPQQKVLFGKELTEQVYKLNGRA